MKKLFIILTFITLFNCKDELPDCDCGTVVKGSIGHTIPGSPNTGSSSYKYYTPITVVWNCTGYQEQVKVKRNYIVGDTYCR